MSSLIQDRKVYWPDLFSRGDDTASSNSENGAVDGFWQHEWQTHGVCALACDANVTSLKDYFALALDLAKKIDIDQALQAASIRPSNSAPVLSQEVVDAVKEATGVTPLIFCHRDKNTDVSYLSEIHLCVTPGNHELMNCDADTFSSHGACPAKVLYPETSDF